MEDISKSTIAVLLVLVVLTSVIGTWVFLNTMITVTEPGSEITKAQSQGSLTLNVVKPPKQSEPSTASPTLTVLKPE